MNNFDGESAGQNPTYWHSHFAGRAGAGAKFPIITGKNGVRHVRQLPNGEESEVIAVGLACSECLSGPRLAKVLKPGFDLETKIMEDLMAGNYAASLSTHTSSGVPEALGEFVEAIEEHLPWKDAKNLDWCLSVQMEGASAVWAGIDLLLQELFITTGSKERCKVAVGAVSYHGPPSTSFGSKVTLWQKHHQLKYPVPLVGTMIDPEKLLRDFDDFLDEHAHEIGVLIVEPQWGSSQTSLPWPKELLRQYIKRAQARGIRVLADEIMCGLFRHGFGTMFISEAWDLDPDGVTFGKAIAAGVYQLSGAIMKRGRDLLKANKRTVMQSHTYTATSTRAFMTAAAVLKELPNWNRSISKLGEEMQYIFRYLERIAQGMLVMQGQGLMWGAYFTEFGQNKDPEYRRATIESFKKHCNDVRILPYHVPCGGFMVTPVVDIDVGAVYEIGMRLEEAIKRTLLDRDWVPSNVQCGSPIIVEPAFFVESSAPCLSHLHATKSCTACTSFVCRDVRMRFMREV